MFNRAVERGISGANAEAATLYTCSYSLVPHPNTLYNLAVVQEAAGQLLDACTVLELYLMQAPNAINREDAEKLLAEIRARIEASGGTPPGPPDVPPDGGGGTDGGATTNPPGGDGTGGTGVVGPGMSDMALAGWILLGTGVALAAGGGTAFAVLAADEKSLVLDVDPGTPWNDVEQHRRVRPLLGAEIAFFAVGVPCWRLVLRSCSSTWRKASRRRRASPCPSHPGMVGLMVGRFDVLEPAVAALAASIVLAAIAAGCNLSLPEGHYGC